MCRYLFFAGALLVESAAVAIPAASAQVVDYSRYPDFKGQWERFVVRGVFGQPSFDQTRPWGKGQQAPLTPEYQAIHEASLADQAAGGLGGDVDHTRCGAEGMPFMMVAFRPLEFVITPETTYIIIADYDPLRRVFTDGRDWPKYIEPTFGGYSIGKWIDENGDGRYDVLEVETRGFKGPREFDATGLPMHEDNQSIFKERIYLDKADRNILHDEITVIDHALTRPWTVDKRYTRNLDPRPEWFESICAEYNAQVFVGNQHYYLSADGFLMPTRPDQPPPDTRYFKKTPK
ncbi:MAG TPA: hypothetical protein VGI22_28910 [Xanthobacteraceae bacterium]|jgi:hypothetical protein